MLIKDMGRGDNNLLFSPHLLKKERRAKGQPYLGQSGTLLVGARELLLQEGMTLLRDESQGLFSLEKDFTTASRGVLPPRISPEAQIALSRDKFIWGDGDGFVIQDLAGKRGAFYKDSIPGILTGLCINDEGVFATALDSKQQSLSRLYYSSANDESGWQEPAGYSYGQPSIIKKGDHAFVFYPQSENKLASLVTLSPSLGQMLFLPPGFINRSDPQKLVAATAANKFLAIAENERGGVDLKHLFLESATSSDPAGEGFIASLGPENGIESSAFKSIAASQGRALVLGNRELILADEKEILHVIPLGEKGDYWDQVAFLSDRALLWKRDGDLYQEVVWP